MGISGWSSDVCSSDLSETPRAFLDDMIGRRHRDIAVGAGGGHGGDPRLLAGGIGDDQRPARRGDAIGEIGALLRIVGDARILRKRRHRRVARRLEAVAQLEQVLALGIGGGGPRSEEHTSELQSLMRISYAVFCLKKKKNETKQ